ncbi:MAG: hypothetical protein O3C62_10080 [Actinomycetota bacterium]|nr:hypothetical protein [Actinomycetota bacterium]MDA2972255.1 hypothetical protein [Actinomycetota bacterium]MDA3002014.1 hypothetical protein [Actinomycetota bacterium]
MTSKLRPIVLLGASLLLAGCFTGERPRLMTDETLPPVDDSAISTVIDVLTAPPDGSAFTVVYRITTKFGGQTTDGSIVVDPLNGTSVQIADTRYVTLLDGSTVTCSTVTDTCVPGVDETRVADRMLNSRIFRDAIVDRLRQDANVAVGDSSLERRSIAERPASCARIPVVDGSGFTQQKSYCVFDGLGVLASFDGADLFIDTERVLPTADPAVFATTQ